MSAHNRVIWHEGLFLQPQHFQQQDRYFERYIESRCRGLIPNSWGFTDIEFEFDLLKIGKVGLARLAGVLPDGTPFRMPDDDPLPAPIDIGPEIRDQRLVLAVPLRRPGELDVALGPGSEDLARDVARDFEAPDASAAGSERAMLRVAALRGRLLLESQATEAYTGLPLCHILECRADGQVILDDRFIPTVLQTRAAPRLATFTTELLGLVRQRGDALGRRVVASGRGEAAELSDFLMLLLINRLEPRLAHYQGSGGVHPEDLYQLLASTAGELATFTTAAKRSPVFPAYRHDHLKESFEPVIASLRQSLSTEFVQNAMAIPLEAGQYGFSRAVVADRSLFNSAVFILAAKAEGPAENVRQRFPSQVKIGPAAKIGELVRHALPGVPVVAMPAAPRQIPFHAGYAYFELDQSHDLWEQLKVSGGLAIHVPADFTGLTMELWAIRS